VVASERNAAGGFSGLGRKKLQKIKEVSGQIQKEEYQ
jgi:hypothetical protein